MLNRKLFLKISKIDSKTIEIKVRIKPAGFGSAMGTAVGYLSKHEDIYLESNFLDPYDVDNYELINVNNNFDNNKFTLISGPIPQL